MNKPSFEVVYQQNYSKVLHYCLRLTHDMSSAEDFAQAAFLQAFKNWDKFRGDSAVSTWLIRIAFNEVFAHKRKYFTKVEVQMEFKENGELLQPFCAPDQVIESTPERLMVNKALNDLQRSANSGANKVFRLFAIYGYSHREIARILGIKFNTSKARCYRAKMMLRKHLAAQEAR